MRNRARGVRLWPSLFRALLAVPWMFLWVIPLTAAMHLPAELATPTLAALTALFVWRNVVRPRRSRPRTAAMFRLTPWRQYIGWVSAAAIAQFAVMFATVRLHEQLAEWRLLPKLPGTPDIIPSHFLGHALGLVATFVAVVILTPLVEEFACRGKMQYRLEHALGVVPAIAIPAVIFSLLHGLTIAIHQLPFALFVGWLVWRTASIWPAVYVHALNNTAVLVLIYLRGESAPYEPPSPWLWPSAIVIGLLGLGGLLTAASRINRLAQRSARNVASSGHGPANNQLSPVARG